MSSPHEPQAGPLQPEEPVAFHQSTRCVLKLKVLLLLVVRVD